MESVSEYKWPESPPRRYEAVKGASFDRGRGVDVDEPEGEYEGDVNPGVAIH